jgi:multidrug resistance protein, MATE family
LTEGDVGTYIPRLRHGLTESHHPRSELVELIRLAWPIAIAQFGLVAIGLVDTAILGHVSVSDLAGAAIGRNIAFAVLSVPMGVVMSLEPLAAQAVGGGDPARARQAFRATLRASVALWFPAVAATFAATLALAPLGIEPLVIARSRAFLLGQAPSMLLFLVYLSAKTFLQSHGSTGPALVASVVANLWNAIACALLVRGDDALVAAHLPAIGLPSFGAFGAGVATSSASLVLAAIMLAPACAKGRESTDSNAHAPFGVTKIIRLGLPVGLQMLAEIGVFAVVALVAGRFGSSVLSAHQIALGLASFTFMSALGVSGATAVLVGQAVGAGRSPRRTGLLGIALGAAAMSVGALVFRTLPEPLAAVFSIDRDVIVLGGQLIAIASVFQLFDGVQAVAAGALRGAGDLRFAFAANVVGHWCIGFPVALFFGFVLGWGARGLWWGLTAGLITVSIMLLGRFLLITKHHIVRIDTT